MDGLFSNNNSTFSSNGYNGFLAYSDSNNFYILIGTNGSPPSGTFYYKLVATWIDNYDTTNPLIEPVFDTTLVTTNTTNFDSRANYQKIYDQEPLNLATSSHSHTINHPLGYIPNYKIYMESLPGQVWPAIAGGVQNPWLYTTAQIECYGLMTSTALTLSYDGGSGSSSNFRAWYRIYYDS